ncbi:WXG100 family type VII secretion target [Cytobacillus horneckiae]|uniref:ESAT-6-like protein n=1 Tax=Cytobacillus horneckiae TaxID=549687 RepID=A0A2N0ZCE4_9BACI|nr:WXG100 family type VII secretion target [Cytobacillus horneckiae]NRG46216.1 WXG100 family type VII secretion target [Bacillus sp. CRN 9]MBN6889561.1 WXG100 family type VII secretion target [Cytobacillus horneckiae]MCM3180972.1 WXG100 family type VII secretion target [Cytobacillus horneckiae]MEC1158141.1 WXG100 family type VII secretion target [Cytobacillus horneckiae]MED2936412.1 WXG100 family type VII secretion target [Cytobacillus horneckiae]
MSGIIRVTPAELEGMSARYNNESSQVEDQLSRLDRMIEELQGMWEGESSRAFADQYVALRPSIVDMQRLLTEVSVQLKNTAHALADADSQIASQIRG